MSVQENPYFKAWDELRLRQEVFSVPLETKNETIRNTLKKTRERRETQTCKQYELKVDASHLSDQTLKHLNRLFLEAKWLYNHVLAEGRIFEADYRVETEFT